MPLNDVACKNAKPEQKPKMQAESEGLHNVQDIQPPLADLLAASAANIRQQTPFTTGVGQIITSPVVRRNLHIGVDTFRVPHLRATGGVHSQNSVVYDINGQEIAIKIAKISSEKPYPGNVRMYTNGIARNYPISYADLVPLVLFVDGGGDGLYTAWEVAGTSNSARSPANDNLPTLPAGYPKEQGYAKHQKGGYVALEFKYSRFSQALHYADFCQACLGMARDAVKDKINSAIERRVSASNAADLPPTNGSYINSDVEGTYLLTDTHGLEAQIFRFSWESSKDAEYANIRKAVEFLQPKDLPSMLENVAGFRKLILREESIIEAYKAASGPLEKMKMKENIFENLNKMVLYNALFIPIEYQKRVAEFQDRFADLLEQVAQAQDDTAIDAISEELAETADLILQVKMQSFPDAEELMGVSSRQREEMHNDVFFVYETLSLLRSFKTQSPKAWQQFVASVRGLAPTYPKPWQDYTRAYCEVYNAPACN